MTRFVSLQTNFSSGVMDPLLLSRVDLAAYQNALSEAKNVVIQPQGGARRRAGLKYLTALPNSGISSAANGVRCVPFEFSVSDSYMLVFTHYRMYVFRNKALVTNINSSGNSYLDLSSYGLTYNMLDNLCWTQSADTLILTNTSMNPIKIVRGGSSSSWSASLITFDSIPKYAFTISLTNPAGTLTPSDVAGKVTLTAAGGTFTVDSVGQYVNASPQGRAKIVSYVNSSTVQAITEFPFFNTSAIASGSWDYETGYEPVWSSTRGYPATVTFHEGRLYFGGSRSRPSTVWGSRVGLFFDFEATEGLDDDAVEATLDTNTYNLITDLMSGRDLQIFTSGGEFYVPQSGLEPITPTNFFVRTISRNGSKQGIRVQQLDSGTLFIQRQGKSLNEMAFSDTQLTYLTNKISLLSGHLLKSPSRIALRRTVATDENDLLLIVNSTDGSIAVFSLLRQQNVIAPSEFITDGQFIDVAVDITTMYAIVKRTVNGVVQYFVEYFDDNTYTDSAVQGTAASSASAAHLVAKTVNVKLDGTVQADQVVPAGGTVTFPRSSTASYEVGLPYDVSISTQPIELRLASGSRIGFKKRIVEVNAILKDTQHLKINSIEVPIRSFDSASILDADIPDYTGIKTLHGILGYSQDAKITVSQNLPLKMTLLGIEYKVSVHQGT